MDNSPVNAFRFLLGLNNSQKLLVIIFSCINTVVVSQSLAKSVASTVCLIAFLRANDREEAVNEMLRSSTFPSTPSVAFSLFGDKNYMYSGSTFDRNSRAGRVQQRLQNRLDNVTYAELTFTGSAGSQDESVTDS